MKKIVSVFPLENTDVQAVEVPKGTEFLSVVSQISQVGLVTSQGQKAARIVMNLYAAFDPTVKEIEKFKIYILGLNVENDIPETAKFVSSCSIMGGQYVFHIYVDKCAD